MRTKRCDWVNPKTCEVKYGFQVFAGGRWCHAAEDGKPCLYDTKQERDLKQAEARKLKGAA